MTSEVVRFKFFDASALVKLYIKKEDNQQLREFYCKGTNFFTTWLCLAEALGVLKSKWSGKQSKNNSIKIETDEYLNAVCSLIIEWRDRIESDDIKSVDPSVPLHVREFAEKYNLDYSDALQLWSIKRGRLSPFVDLTKPNVHKSALILITADKGLAAAAKSEGINVWNCTTGPAPRWAY
jgi:predicted nucleic acid-binding protein